MTPQILQSAPRRVRGQSGSTLVEVLVVVAVSIPLILSATMGLMLSLGLGSHTEKTQKTEADATSFAELIKDLPYVECATSVDYQSAVDEVVLPGIQAELAVTDVAYWDQSTGDYSLTDCTTDDGPADGGAQLVTIEVTRAELVSTLQVVKRDPEARVDGDTP